VLDAVVKPSGVAAAAYGLGQKREQMAEMESLDEEPVAASRSYLRCTPSRLKRMYARAPERPPS